MLVKDRVKQVCGRVVNSYLLSMFHIRNAFHTGAINDIGIKCLSAICFYETGNGVLNLDLPYYGCIGMDTVLITS